jgi:hypothetical protein
MKIKKMSKDEEIRELKVKVNDLKVALNSERIRRASLENNISNLRHFFEWLLQDVFVHSEG